jgi:hypothetical protein
MTFATDLSMSGSKDAARPIGDGKMVPMFVKPCRPVDVLSNGGRDGGERLVVYLRIGLRQEYPMLCFPSYTSGPQ